MKVTRYSDIMYKHPATIDADPLMVAKPAIDALADASLMYARHVDAVVRQVRSSYLSKVLREDPDASPSKLTEAWEASAEARECVMLMRSAKAARTCVKRLQNLTPGDSDQG